MSLREQKFKVGPVNFASAVLLLSTIISGIGLHTVGAANEDYSFDVNFSRGTSFDTRDVQTLEEVVALTNANSNYVIRLVGHTGTLGTQDANILLGTQRAEVVKQLLIERNVSNEIVVSSAGGDKPLAKISNETDRDYQNRLSRVTIDVESDL